MLFNPNRFVFNTDDIYGIHRVETAEEIHLPGTATFYVNPTEVKMGQIDFFNCRYVEQPLAIDSGTYDPVVS